MIKQNIIFKLNKRHNFFLKIQKKYFKMLSPEEYLINMTESVRRTGVEACKLRPLPEASK